MRVVKSVSLPVELAEKASKLPNFSVFIQEALQHGADAEEARQKVVITLKRRIRLLDNALYRVLNEPGWSNKARKEIIAIMESSGVIVELLEPIKGGF